MWSFKEMAFGAGVCIALFLAIAWQWRDSMRADRECQAWEAEWDARDRIRRRRAWKFSHLCSDGRRWWFKDPEGMP